MRNLLPFIIALTAIACSKPQPDPVTPVITYDAAPVVFADSGTACELACANLAALGCPEGDGNCNTVCEHTMVLQLTDLRPECLAKAKTRSDAILCGSVTCKSH